MEHNKLVLIVAISVFAIILTSCSSFIQSNDSSADVASAQSTQAGGANQLNSTYNPPSGNQSEVNMTYPNPDAGIANQVIVSDTIPDAALADSNVTALAQAPKVEYILDANGCGGADNTVWCEATKECVIPKGDSWCVAVQPLTLTPAQTNYLPPAVVEPNSTSDSQTPSENYNNSAVDPNLLNI